MRNNTSHLAARTGAVLLPLLLSACLNPLSNWFPPDVTYATTPGPLGLPVISLYVAPWGDDDGPATKAKPLRTLQNALNRSRVDHREDDLDGTRLRVFVAGGPYSPGQGLVPDAASGARVEYPSHALDGYYDVIYELSFGWDPTFTTQRAEHPSRLSGEGQYSAGVLSLAGSAVNAVSLGLGVTWYASGGGGPPRFDSGPPTGGFRVEVSGPLEVQP